MIPSDGRDEPVIEAVVFDLDGTLIHSVPDMLASVNNMLAGQGAPPLDEQTVQSFVGDGLSKLVERVIEASGLDMALHEDLTACTLDNYNRENGKRTRAYEGVPETLQALGSAGLNMGICTNKPEAPARHILAHLGLSHHFAVIVGGDTLPVRKPDPEPLIHTARALQATPETMLYVGDSEVDAATAEAAGVPFALYTQGYRKSPVEAFRTVFAFDHFDVLREHLHAVTSLRERTI